MEREPQDAGFGAGDTTSKVDELFKTNQKLSKTMEEYHAQILAFEDQIAELQQWDDDNRQKLEEQSTEITHLKTANRHTQRECEGLRKENDALKPRNEFLEQKISSNRLDSKKLDELTRIVEDYHGEGFWRVDEVTDVRMERDDALIEVRGLEGDLVACEENLQEAMEHIKALQEDKDELSHRLDLFHTHHRGTAGMDVEALTQFLRDYLNEQHIPLNVPKGQQHLRPATSLQDVPEDQEHSHRATSLQEELGSVDESDDEQEEDFPGEVIEDGQTANPGPAESLSDDKEKTTYSNSNIYATSTAPVLVQNGIFTRSTLLTTSTSPISPQKSRLSFSNPATTLNFEPTETRGPQSAQDASPLTFSDIKSIQARPRKLHSLDQTADKRPSSRFSEVKAIEQEPVTMLHAAEDRLLNEFSEIRAVEQQPVAGVDAAEEKPPNEFSEIRTVGQEPIVGLSPANNQPQNELSCIKAVEQQPVAGIDAAENEPLNEFSDIKMVEQEPIADLNAASNRPINVLSGIKTVEQKPVAGPDAAEDKPLNAFSEIKTIGQEPIAGLDATGDQLPNVPSGIKAVEHKPLASHAIPRRLWQWSASPERDLLIWFAVTCAGTLFALHFTEWPWSHVNGCAPQSRFLYSGEQMIMDILRIVGGIIHWVFSQFYDPGRIRPPGYVRFLPPG